MNPRVNWDDFRFVLAVSKAGSLLRAGAALRVDHTTVGRRVAAAERALGVSLFTRTTTGLVPTMDGERLLASMRGVEQAVLSVERGAQRDPLAGKVRVTSPETFGVSYIAPRLASFAREHPGLTVELLPAGEVLDLGRRQAEIAVRMFRSRGEHLRVRRVGSFAYGLYASHAYLARHPVRSKDTLHEHTILGAPGEDDVDTMWLRKLNAKARPAFLSALSIALVGAAKASAGVAVLPRYLGDAEPDLKHIPMPDEPSEPIFLTVHDDLKRTPRVRTLLDFLATTIAGDEATLMG